MEKEGKRAKRSVKKELMQWIKALIIVVVIVLIVRSFVFRTVYVKGSSMEPNFSHGEIVLMQKLSYYFSSPQYGDVVVCRGSTGASEELLIKRVIGMPGDEIDIYLSGDQYLVERNGEVLEEPFIREKMQQKGDVEYPFIVPEDSYFVMGDNRNASSDSRNKRIGAVPRANILGKVEMVIWPLSEAGTVEEE